jgi:hypothetical protein
MTTGGLLRCCCAPAGDFAYRSAAAAGRLVDGAPRRAAAQHCAVILTSRRRNSAMANSGPYGGGYQGYAGQSYAGYGSDIVPPPATPNPRDAADCAFKRPKYPGWLCPLHVDSRQSLKRLKCANSGHSATDWRTGQIGPFAALRGRPCERTVSARKRSSAQGVGCASSYRSNWLRNCTGERELPLESAGLWQLRERNE